MSNFLRIKTVKQLQQILRDREVAIAQQNKAVLVDLCQAALELNLPFDPDGIIEDRQTVISAKLTTHNNIVLINPDLILDFTYNLGDLPPLSIFDIYNYLLQSHDYDHEALREYHNLEGYTMFQDGYVLDVQVVKFQETGYFAVRSKIKPRTRDKDPVTCMPFYRAWIIFSNVTDNSVYSAFCCCKGGADGFCRHIVATLFELESFLNDRNNISATSNQCLWVKRAKHNTNPVPAIEIETKVVEDQKPLPVEEQYNPVPPNISLPKVEDFFQVVERHLPRACILDTHKLKLPELLQSNPLTVLTPMAKLEIFLSCHKCTDTLICDSDYVDELFSFLAYDSSEISSVQRCTLGQTKNPNWTSMRRGLLTASNFKAFCCSRNLTKTAIAYMARSRLNEDTLPWHIAFGVKFEEKARQMWINSHKFKHKGCKVTVPGLILSSETPYLGATPDGIVECPMCATALLEIKCLSSKRSFHPKVALVMLNICEKLNNGYIVMKKDHRYYYQVQGQMAVTGILKCYFIAYIYKGIFTLEVEFNSSFWSSVQEKLNSFYVKGLLPVLKGGKVYSLN